MSRVWGCEASQDFWEAGVGVLESQVGREFYCEELMVWMMVRTDGLDLLEAIVLQGIKQAVVRCLAEGNPRHLKGNQMLESLGQAPLSMEFSRQEYWSGLPSPHPRDLSDPGIELASLTSPALSGRVVVVVFFLTISTFFFFFTILGFWEAQRSA